MIDWQPVITIAAIASAQNMLKLCNDLFANLINLVLNVVLELVKRIPVFPDGNGIDETQRTDWRAARTMFPRLVAED